ncbi:hypothetical protein [Thiocystis minor]|uniref:competence protein CoiA family protein n=1 Tax=Thiocystis minor TaxID=61597 RepID=UPI0019136C31|nr:hypothetical protein [Thiocystis minor]
MSVDVLYRWAHDPSNVLVDVSKLDSDSRGGPYTCIACGRGLIPKLGAVKTHHFAHAVSVAATCSGESYLHKLGKLMFVRGFESAREGGRAVKLCYDRPLLCGIADCEYRSEHAFHDLARIFDRVEIEAPYRGCVVDVLLSDSRSDRVLAVEMAVTHQCDAEKIARGFPIVELVIRSEAQCKALAAHYPRIDSYRAFNFKTIPPRRVLPYSCRDCPGADLFLVHASGKPFMKSPYLGESLPSNRLFTHVFGVSSSISDVAGMRFFEGVFLALEAGHQVVWRPTEKRIWANLYDWLRAQGEQGRRRAKLMGLTLDRPKIAINSYRDWSRAYGSRAYWS